MNAMIGFCLVPLIFYIIAFNTADKGKSPWIPFAIGAAFVVVAGIFTIVHSGFGPQHVASILITGVFAYVFVKQGKKAKGE